MENVKVAIWGFGAMGAGIAETLLNKKGVDIVGVCVRRPSLAGKNVFDLLEMDAKGREPILISNDIDEVLGKGKCDICLICTDSFVEKVYDKVIVALEHGVNVVTTAEEMAYPQAQFPELSAKMDECAKKNGVSVLGTGINPGLVMDLLAVCLSGSMTDIETVMCRRVNSLSPFGVSVMEEQGVGMEVDEFNKRVAEGTMSGHVGFAESVAMINDAMGLGVDEFGQSMAPIVTTVDRKSPYGEAKAGKVAGVDMKGWGKRDGELIIDMQHPQQIEPEDENVFTGDYIVLKGTPEISMEIKPEISGGIGTIAMCVNSIPHTINARAGLITMLDIPAPHVIMRDFRDYIDPVKKLV